MNRVLIPAVSADGDVGGTARARGDGAAVLAHRGCGSRFTGRSGIADPAARTRVPWPQATDFPCYRTIVALDIEKSTTCTNPVKAALRQKVYELFESALTSMGIGKRHRDPFVDRGDGVLALIHPVPAAPKALVLSGAIPALNQLLTDYNLSDAVARQAQCLLRIRVVVHAGEVHYDANGCFGEDLDIAFRLLDAKQVKMALQRTTAPSALVISDEIFLSGVRHGYGGIDKDTFRPIPRVNMADQRHRGWIQLPEISMQQEPHRVINHRQLA